MLKNHLNNGPFVSYSDHLNTGLICSSNHFQNLRTKIMQKFALADVNADADFSTEKFAHADTDSAHLCGFGCGFCKNDSVFRVVF